MYIETSEYTENTHCQFSEFSFTFIFWHYIHEEINNQDHVGFFFVKIQQSRSASCDYTKKVEFNKKIL